MPLKKFKKKAYAKKSYRKKRTTRRYARKRIPLAGTPQSQLVKFRYVTRIVLDAPATGYVSTYTYRCIGVSDPDYASGGNTCQNWTDYQEHYKHYVCLGSKITVKQVTTLATATVPGMFGIVLSRSADPFVAAATTSMDIIRSSGSFGGNNKYRVTGGLNPAAISTLTRSFSTRKFYSIPKKDAVATYPGVKSDTNTTPVENPCFTIWTGNNVAASDPSPQSFYVEIDYICKVWEPNFDMDL